MRATTVLTVWILIGLAVSLGMVVSDAHAAEVDDLIKREIGQTVNYVALPDDCRVIQQLGKKIIYLVCARKGTLQILRIK